MSHSKRTFGCRRSVVAGTKAARLAPSLSHVHPLQAEAYIFISDKEISRKKKREQLKNNLHISIK